MIMSCAGRPKQQAFKICSFYLLFWSSAFLNVAIKNVFGTSLPFTSDFEIRCRPAHGFHHVLSMTGNMSEFTRVIKRQRISGNMDTPEGGLDAMLQAAVCQVCVYNERMGYNNILRSIFSCFVFRAYTLNK